MTALTEAVAAVLERQLSARLGHIKDAAKAETCVVCGHTPASHNELGYCRVRSKGHGDCGCDSGVTIGSTASVILRDMPHLSAAIAAAVESVVEAGRAEDRARLAAVRSLLTISHCIQSTAADRRSMCDRRYRCWWCALTAALAYGTAPTAAHDPTP